MRESSDIALASILASSIADSRATSLQPAHHAKHISPNAPARIRGALAMMHNWFQI
jgi:hypothetical protein